MWTSIISPYRYANRINKYTITLHSTAVGNRGFSLLFVCVYPANLVRISGTIQTKSVYIQPPRVRNIPPFHPFYPRPLFFGVVVIPEAGYYVVAASLETRLSNLPTSTLPREGEGILDVGID